jgi:diguanylate cyclase (GGDEF)-like protein/PAS domain S-box-containing protein
MTADISLSPETLALVFESVREGVAIFGEDGRLIRCNPALSELLGRSGSDLAGKTPREGWGGRCLGESCAGGRPLEHWTERACRADGREISLSVRVLLESAGQAEGVRVAFYAETPEEKSAVDAIVDGRDDGALNRVLELIAAGGSLAETLDWLIRAVEKRCPAAMGAILLLDSEGQTLRLESSPRLPEAYRALADGLPVGPEASVSGAAAFLGERVVAENVETDPRWTLHREAARAHGLRACWAQPIRGAEGKMLGSLTLYLAQARGPSERESRALESAARLAGLAIERVRAAEALRESRQKLRLVMDHIPQAIFWKDRKSIFRGCNWAFARAVGASHPSQVVGRADYDLCPRKDQARVFRESDRRVMKTGKPELGIVGDYERPDGSVILMETNKIPLRDAQGQIVGVLGTFEDITARKRAEEDSRESRRMLRLVIDNIPQGVFWKNRDSALLGCNRAFARVAGMKRPKDINKPGADLPWTPEQREMFRAIDQRVMETGRPEHRIVQPLRLPDGETACLETSKIPLRNAKGEIVGILGVLEDITERRRSEAALRQSEERHRRFVETANEGVWVLDADGKTAYVNQRMAEMLGHKPADMMGRSAFDFVAPEDRAKGMEGFARRRAGISEQFDLRYRRADGSDLWAIISASPLFDGEGRFAGGLAMVTDITRRREAEEELRRETLFSRKVAAAIPYLLYVFNIVEKRNVYTNGRMAELLGYPPAEMQAAHDSGETLAKLLHPEDWSVLDKNLSRWRDVDDETVIETEYRLRSFEGEWRWFLSRDVVFSRDASGAVRETLGVAQDITERRRAEEALRESEQRYREMFVKNQAVKLIINPRSGQIEDANPAAAEFYGYPLEQLRSMSIWDINTLQPEEIRRRMSEAKTEKKMWFFFPHRLASGEIRQVEVQSGPITLQGETYLYSIIQDATEREQAREALRQERDKAQTYLDIARAAFVALDARGCVEMINRRGCEMLGQPEPEILGRDWFDSFLPPWLRDRAKKRFLQLVAGEHPVLEIFESPLVGADGQRRVVAWHTAPLRDAQGRVVGMISSGQDVTERRRAEKRLTRLAFRDSLTGLPNRTSFMERLEAALEARRGSEPAETRPAAVLYLDVDRFKVVNDSLGHAIGDQMLAAAGRRLRQFAWPGAFAARLGGDEFAILLPAVEGRAEAERAAEASLAAISGPCQLEGHEVFICASAGVALADGSYERPEDVLRDADAALYKAKESGRARHAVFDQAMRARAARLLRLESDLRRAVQRGEFHVEYQPIVSLREGCLRGFEALLRWVHPERGLIGPSEFIPVAEETGLIAPLGLWTLREACRQLRAWRREHPAEAEALTISVNISGRQFSQAGLDEMVGETLLESGLPPDRLRLEITESVVMEDPEGAAAILERLRQLGTRLHIDDFGTGYCSLSYLRRFPIDCLKIDRSFVEKIAVDPHIARAIVDLARNLNIGVTAEGIETPEQLAVLRALECEAGQGYFFARPMKPEDARKLIVQAPRW